MTAQPDLFGAPVLEPEGLRLEARFLEPGEQDALAARFAALPFAPFEFHGWTGARRVVSFGSRYDFARGRLEPADPLPGFLRALADRAADWAGLPPEAIAQALITEYRPGAGIGWHRDRPQYGQVVGLSFGAPCRLRFRRRDGAGWARRAVDLPPGSAYRLDGPARWDWEHGIAPLAALRYSATFRTLRAPSDG